MHASQLLGLYSFLLYEDGINRKFCRVSCELSITGIILVPVALEIVQSQTECIDIEPKSTQTTF